MSLLRSAWLFAAFAATAVFGMASSANAQTFSFEVCNKSGLTAYVATSSHPAVGDDRYVVEGWWTVAAGNCTTIGTFPEGWFYFFAEASGGNWSGNFPLCVQYPGPFKVIHTTGVTCPSNRLKEFTEKQITSSGTFTWTLNP